MMRTYLLMFADGSGMSRGILALLRRLDENAEILSVEGQGCFIRTSLDAAAIADRFLDAESDSLFFVTEISPSDHAGRMGGAFWDFIKGSAPLSTAA